MAMLDLLDEMVADPSTVMLLAFGGRGGGGGGGTCSAEAIYVVDSSTGAVRRGFHCQWSGCGCPRFGPVCSILPADLG